MARKKNKIRRMIAFLGDINIGGKVSAEFGEYGPDRAWGDVLPHLQNADATIANLECPVTSSLPKWQKPKIFKFRADPAAIAILQSANIQLVNIANNHILDRREQGLIDTCAHLDAAGIERTGAGENSAMATAPAFIKLGDFKVAMAGFTDNIPEWTAGPASPGHHFMNIRTDTKTRLRVTEMISEMRTAGADLVIISAHWGINYVLRSHKPKYRAFARMVIEAGADIFHGHSAHLFDAVEPWQDGLILYDCGDNLHDYIPFILRPSEWSMIYSVELEGSRPVGVKMIPGHLGQNRITRPTSALRRRMLARMKKLCAARNVFPEHHPDGLYLEIS